MKLLSRSILPLLCLIPLSMAAQEAAPSAHRPMLLDVVVTDKAGKPVSGLKLGDFSVLDNGQPSSVVGFRAHSSASVPAGQVDASTQVVLILDEVNADYNEAHYGADQLKQFLKQNGGNLNEPVSVGIFTDKGLQMQTQPTTDGNALANALGQQAQGFRTVGETGTGFYGAEERLKLSMDAMQSLLAMGAKMPGRKMVIWVSPGWPLLSGDRARLSDAQMQHIFQSVVQLSVALQKARMTLYSVDLEGAPGAGTPQVNYYKNFTAGLVEPKRAEMGDLGLQVLATQSGGRVIFGNDSVVHSVGHCLEDLSAFYTLAINPAPSEKPNVYHKLDVRVGRDGLKARTRSGYYAQP